jgi:hypothetical protein
MKYGNSFLIIPLMLVSFAIKAENAKHFFSECESGNQIVLQIPKNAQNGKDVVKLLESFGWERNAIVSCVGPACEARLDCYRCCLEEIPNNEICKNFEYGKYKREHKCNC